MKKSIMFLALLALGLTVQKVMAGGPPPPRVPDGGSTALLLTSGIGALVWCKNRLSR